MFLSCFQLSFESLLINAQSQDNMTWKIIFQERDFLPRVLAQHSYVYKDYNSYKSITLLLHIWMKIKAFTSLSYSIKSFLTERFSIGSDNNDRFCKENHSEHTKNIIPYR